MFTSFQEVKTFFVSRQSQGIKPGLDRIKKLLQLLGDPQDNMKAIHIAGTNGKGSTLHFINHALLANGYRVGIFTSPSMEGLTGHMFMDDIAITEAAFIKLCNQIHPFIKQLDNENMSPTEFEIITALAFVYFSRDVDIVLVEAGMGGREDTTNCFQPIMSIITNISQDHTAFLGNSLAEIAYHKAGIIKKGVPVILGDMTKEAMIVIDEEIRLKMTNGYQLGHDFTYKMAGTRNDFTWHYQSELHKVTGLRMYGEHQVKNGSMALMALFKLKEIGYSINFKQAIEAIKQTQVPGRFEIIQRIPEIILDGAHNSAGMQSFIYTVSSNFAYKEKHLIFAAFKDKDLETMLDQVNGQFTTITLTSFDHPRAAKAEALYDLTKEDNKYINSDWQEVINNIINQEDASYFITGSLHFIAMVREYLLKIPVQKQYHNRK